jgi:hypothetical protein
MAQKSGDAVKRERILKLVTTRREATALEMRNVGDGLENVRRDIGNIQISETNKRSKSFLKF